MREESTMNKIKLVAIDLAKRCYQVGYMSELRSRSLNSLDGGEASIYVPVDAADDSLSRFMFRTETSLFWQHFDVRRLCQIACVWIPVTPLLGQLRLANHRFLPNLDTTAAQLI